MALRLLSVPVPASGRGWQVLTLRQAALCLAVCIHVAIALEHVVDVVRDGARVEVGRIATGRVVAVVEYLEPARDASVREAVCHPGGWDHAGANAERSVSIEAGGALPWPTLGGPALLHLGPEALLECWRMEEWKGWGRGWSRPHARRAADASESGNACHVAHDGPRARSLREEAAAGPHLPRRDGDANDDLLLSAVAPEQPARLTCGRSGVRLDSDEASEALTREVSGLGHVREVAEPRTRRKSGAC